MASGRSRKETVVTKRPRDRKAKPTKKKVGLNVCESCGKKRKFNPSKKHGDICQKCRAKKGRRKISPQNAPVEPSQNEQEPVQGEGGAEENVSQEAPTGPSEGTPCACGGTYVVKGPKMVCPKCGDFYDL